MWNIIFFKDFQTIILEKKKKKKERWKKKEKRRNKEGKTQFVINYRSPSHEPNNSTCFLPLVSGREISDMILIIRRNISSNGYNQYY